MTIDYPEQTATQSGSAAAIYRRVAFGFLATFIALGPAPGELLGMHSLVLREWRMFAGAGVGLVRGKFTLHRATGDVTLSPLEVVGLPRYLDLPINRRVFKLADMREFAKRICDDKNETARLSFEGSVGVASGWTSYPVDDVCHGDVTARRPEISQ
jgi:hypothetical protein